MAGEEVIANIFGYTPEQIAAYRAATAASTVPAALDTTAGAAGTVNPIFGPLSIITGMNSYFSNKWAQEAAQDEIEQARRRAALEEMDQLGIDPREIYSRDAISNLLDTPAGRNVLSGVYPGDINTAIDAGLTPEDMSNKLVFGMTSDYLRNPQQVAGQYTRDVTDTLGDIWNDPSRVFGAVFGPGGVTGNIEWGGGTMPSTPGSDPAIYTGSPAEGVYTGVTTGNPVIDAAVRRVLNQEVGGKTTTSDVLIEQVAKEAGYPIDEVIDILEGVFEDKGAGMPSPKNPTRPGGGAPTTPPTDQNPSTTVGVDGGESTYQKILDWLGRNKDATDEEIRTAAESAGVTPTDIAGATNTPLDEVQRRWDSAVPDSPGSGEVIDTNVPPGQGAGDIFEPDSDNPIDVPTGPESGGGGGGGGAYDALVPQFQQVDVKESPLAEIDYLYDVGGESIFAPMKESTEEEERENLARIKRLGSVPYGYSQGGQIDVVELARQLLRG